MTVYFVQAGENGPIKIGWSLNALRRLAKMQADNHERLTILGVANVGRTTEAKFHRQFARHRLRGEWFRPASEILLKAARYLVPKPKKEKVFTSLMPKVLINPVIFVVAKNKAIVLAGGTAALARIIGVSSQAISQWRYVPANRARAVERATGGQVSRYDLRSDIFGSLSQACRALQEAS